MHASLSFVLLSLVALTSFAEARPDLSNRLVKKACGVMKRVPGYDCTPTYNDCITGSTDTYSCCVHDVFANGWSGVGQPSNFCYTQHNTNVGNCNIAKNSLSSACQPCTTLTCCETAYINASGHTKTEGSTYNGACTKATPSQIAQYESALNSCGRKRAC